MVVKKHLVFLIPLLILGLFAMRSFWGPEYFDGHDSQAHIIRLYQYDLALKDGQIPPQWAGNLLAGYGYPVFIFAYPLPYMVSEAFHLLGTSLAVAIKLTTVLAYLISIIAMYFFATAYWQKKLAGFLSAILWSYAPYIFVKTFITGSLGVVTSYAFIPLFFLFLDKLLKKPNFKNSLYLALATSGWVLSHLLTPIIFSPLIFIFFAFNLPKNNFKSAIKFLSLSVLITFGLIAWFIVPAVLELQYTYFNQFVTHEYANHFVNLKRLIYSKWGTGAPGWSDNPLSQQVGIAQWLVIGLSSLFILFKNKKTKKLLPFLLTFFLSIFLMLQISKPIWDFLPLLPSVHIPWRFLSLSVFTAAISAGFLLKTIKNNLIKKVVIGLLIFLALYGNRHHLQTNQKIIYPSEFFQNYTGVATGWNEHLPIWIKDIPKEFPQQKVEILEGQCHISNLDSKTHFHTFIANCSQNSIIKLNLAYYPGWQVFDNQQNITNQVKNNLDQSNGIVEFSLSSGTHQILAEFKNTPLRQFSQSVSLATLIIVIYLALKPV